MQSAVKWESERGTTSRGSQAVVSLGLLALYTVLYFLAAVPIASRRPLWSDELFTLFLSRGHSASATWNVLATGADAMPPALYALTHAALALPGPRELLVRLPEMLGFWLMGVCLFAFTARRTSPWHGALAALLPCITAAFTYAVEARSYGLVLGFTGLALVFWQRAGEARSGKLAQAAFGLALMGATAVHYYAILLLVPFAVGETVRFWHERRLRPALWLAMGAALLPIVAVLPLVRGAARMAHSFWAHAEWSAVTLSYTELLGELLINAVFLASLTLVAVSSISWPRRRESSWPVNLPAHEVGAIVALAALPFIAVTAARISTGAYTSRYAIAMLPGVCVLLAWGLYALSGRRVLAAAVFVTVCCVFAVKSVRLYHAVGAQREQVLSLAAFLEKSQPPAMPIVIAGPHLFVQLSHYAPPELGRRIVYLADPELALRATGTDSVDAGLLDISAISGMRVTPFDKFWKSTPDFLVYGYPGDFAWVMPELLSRNLHFAVAGAANDHFLLITTHPPPPAGGAR